MDEDYSQLGAHGPMPEPVLRHEGIAKLLGLNSPRGTSLGVTSQNCSEGGNPYRSSSSTGFNFEDRFFGGEDVTPPSPTSKKPYFETMASPEYCYNRDTATPLKVNTRAIRPFPSMFMESPVLDCGNGPRMIGNGWSDSPSGSGMGTPLADRPFDEMINSMGRVQLGGNEFGKNTADCEYVSHQGAYTGIATVPVNNSLLIQQMNQIYVKQQQQQLILSRFFDDGWINHQLRAGITLEKAARVHRTSAATCNPTCTWSGTLPLRSMPKPNSQFSCKVFLGGVPWDITEASLVGTFQQFGNARVEWPGKESDTNALPKGYVYIIFENDKQVKALLNACCHDDVNGGSWYYRISSRKMKAKEVQVIPWLLCDSNCVKTPSQKLDPQKTVFVGALHGMLNAEGLSFIMNELFGNVVYAGIDTDKFKYPIGSGRVTFGDSRSYMRAVAAAFIDIKTPKFAKKVQVDPYLEDSLCSTCHIQQGPYFCREMSCFRYFCRVCWQCHHSSEAVSNHKPLMRNSKAGPFMLGFSAGARSSK